MNTPKQLRASLLQKLALMLAITLALAVRPANAGTAPNFTIVNHKTGTPLSLYDYQGTVILLDFWAYWCPACQETAAVIEPNITQFYRNAGGNQYGVPVTVISISTDLSDPPAEEDYISTYGLELVGDDTTGSAFAPYDLGFIPQFVVINGLTNSQNFAPWQILYDQVDNYDPDPTVTLLKGYIDSVEGPAGGSLQVTIEPASAVAAGAQWQLDGGAWQNSGAKVGGLSSGNHTVSYKTINGWTAPASQTVAVPYNQAVKITNTYIQHGSLQVTISPSDAVKDGARWAVDGITNQTSGSTVSNLSAGSHTVSFAQVNGWTTPSNQTVTVSDGQSASATGIYMLQIGSLHVAISPPDAVTAGAQWQLDGGAWQNAGATATNLPVGNHTLSFNTVSGWASPSTQNLQITGGQTTLITGNYGPAGTLQVFIAPTGAAAAGALWQVDNRPNQTNGVIVSNLSVGPHTVSFTAMPGWAAPASLSVSIASNQTATATGNYVPQSGSLQVTMTPTFAVSAGAMWAVDGTAYQASGATAFNLLAGNHTLSFKTISGWHTPSNQTVVITNGVTTTASGKYMPPYGVILLTNGFGAIQHGGWPANLANGTKYTVSAVPSAGNFFTNWTGGTNPPYNTLLSTSASYTFVMRSNLVLQANFMTNEFTGAQGGYSGLFSVTNAPRQQTNSGAFTFNVTSTRTFTGKILLGSDSPSLNGTFNTAGYAQVISARKGKSSLTTTMQLDFASQTVSGEVTDGSFVAQLWGNRNGYSAAHPAKSYEGSYTSIIPGTNDSTAGPFGTSYATITINAAGAATVAGSLADGTALSASSAISQDGYWPLYVSLYGGKGSLWGWNVLSNQAVVSASALSWINITNSSTTALYRRGFTNEEASLTGSLYVASHALPAKMNVVLDGGNLPFTITNGVNVATSDKVTLASALTETNKLSLTINKTTGVITGSFANPSKPKQTISVHGIIVQGLDGAAGYFLGTNQSGTFLIENP